MGDLSEHFDSKEFYTAQTYAYVASINPPSWYISKKLITRLEIIRAYFGKPIKITSGFRTVGENIIAGGKELSFHLHGKAADIIVIDIIPEEVQAFCRKHFTDGGLGLGKTFTHIDVRNTKELIVWTY